MKLSICIPTYNFAKFIGETLESIIPQLSDDVEIVILDGASTDNTHEVVQSYQKSVPQIRYFRETERGGIDKDMHLSIEKARGEYCWLFSSDDWMKKGSLPQILQEIKEGHDIYVCGFTICSLDMSRVIEEHRFSNVQAPTVFDLSDIAQRENYFRSAVATPAFFSFMSSLIVNRRRWRETAVDPSFFGTCWAHAARVFCMIPNGLRVKYIPSALLCKRAFNDSFMDKGLVHRMAIAIDGYQDIATKIFGKASVEAFHVRRTLMHEFSLAAFLGAKNQVQGADDLRNIFRLIEKVYMDFRIKRWVVLAIVFALPRRAIPLLKSIYRIRHHVKQLYIKF